jgi:hypothetical protein
LHVVCNTGLCSANKLAQHRCQTLGDPKKTQYDSPRQRVKICDDLALKGFNDFILLRVVARNVLPFQG